MPVLYVDVFWLINAVMDSFILFLTAWMARREVRWWRFLVGAVIGASYALLLFMNDWAKVGLVFTVKVLVSLVIIYATFTPRGLIEWIRLFALFYLASFITGGAAFGLSALFQSGTSVEDRLVYLGGGPVWIMPIKLIFVFAAIPLVYFLGKTAWKRLLQLRRREEHLWHVEVVFCGQSFVLKGLLDTGNSLTDPLSRLPVAVADWSVFRSVLPETIVRAFEHGKDPMSQLGGSEIDAEWQSRLRLVPYRGIGNAMGMLLAFRPDQCICRRENEEYPYERLLIGLNPKGLSSDGTYQMILHPSFLTTSTRTGETVKQGVKGESIA
ncbi:sporulation sigma-E factor-processing peptidase [Collibacillus ludicampi]|uniref:Sporulation sigma-E factor-processing peptidase n=1 Tax=Collibacillus ludicampi TaxID=2771369 RepID=A0AAV4LI11_9BACL|nr:sigma-E processing peptidase SpoIIGA [Collibacillus ludicampi]GIM47461.1 sporulation sigma-E factor-processing peptidase [Collibacillus ludicampi]